MEVLVTGGGGFLGSAVVRGLREQGHHVRSLSRSRYPELEALGVEQHSVDLAEGGAALERAVQGAQAIVHCAAKAGVAGSAASFDRANRVGTLRLLDAAQAQGVERLVYTSSPSVCFDGQDHVRASNDLPYATEFLAAYPRSKAAAEQAALAAHDPAGIRVVALRPHLIFGPGDPHILPRLFERAAQGKLRRVGDGTNEVSVTFVENAAAAHLDALAALEPASPAGGRAYFVGQKEPVQLWPWLAEVLAGVGLPPVRRSISARAAYRIGAVCEAVWRWSRRSSEPPMTRFVARQLATSHSYDMAPLERDVGYHERVPLAEATRRTIAAFAPWPSAGLRT